MSKYSREICIKVIKYIIEDNHTAHDAAKYCLLSKNAFIGSTDRGLFFQIYKYILNSR
jgi:hypothetical protein